MYCCLQEANLNMLQRRALASRCTTVVESGQLPEGMAYLLLQPVGKLLSLDEDLPTLLKVLLDVLLFLYYDESLQSLDKCNGR